MLRQGGRINATMPGGVWIWKCKSRLAERGILSDPQSAERGILSDPQPPERGCLVLKKVYKLIDNPILT